MMRLAFSRSELPLSKAIRWMLNEPCSHLVIVFGDERLMFESNLLGTIVDYWPYFRSAEASIVHEIQFDVPDETANELYDRILMKYAHHSYDWLGFLYFTWRGLLKKFFGRPIPALNKWAQPGQFLCVGLVKSLDTDGVPLWLRTAIREIPDCEMISPETLFQRILRAEQSAIAVPAPEGV